MSGANDLSAFGRVRNGQEVLRIGLRGGGLRMSLLTHGARVQDLRLDGVAHPLVIGADTLGPYLDQMGYHGAIVGRFANRIAGAGFTLDGQEVRTDANEFGRQTLHGGVDGASSQIWAVQSADADTAVLTLELPDGHMGFPGNLRVTATYALPGDGTLALDINATCDAATVCSFAHHGYFALQDGGSVADQTLWIDADRYLPVDDTMIPTADAPAPVDGTRFDFRKPRRIGTAGLDHNFCLNNADGGLRRVVQVVVPDGLSLEVLTDQPGLQIYDSARQPELIGLEGRRHGAFAGIALETQAWPDAVNRPDFPTAVLRPGEVYRHAVRYRFTR
ncbi:aldose epimerase family protein [Puniceibacterium sediminis]|uniref:Aldose 1-epimerase n=1 Tax=Puniceibacterium sediminis TaxID=1608407 RepID=A0A238XF80_9RHOB|nr:aldose epimerase family protein [Puniceibacterium sediminis]SNR57666.1 aldose 1-epimerase [Puniceibacterium sediminis]